MLYIVYIDMYSDLSYVCICKFVYLRSGFYQRAYSCLLEAGNGNTADFFMEKTKWLWNKVCSLIPNIV